MPKPELQAECIRLRVEDRLSLREIATQTGASKGSLSLWLRSYPLTDVEKRGRRVRPPVPLKKDRGQESEISQTVRGNKLNGMQVAKVAETSVLLRMLAQGFNPFGSVFDGDKADWLVDVPETGKILKIQVKTAQQKSHGLPIVSLRYGINSKVGATRYKKGDFDFIVGYDLFTDVCYVWSWDEVETRKTAVTIHLSAAERWDKFYGV